MPCNFFANDFVQLVADKQADFLCILCCCSIAGADSPDGFIGNGQQFRLFC